MKSSNPCGEFYLSSPMMSSKVFWA